MKSLKLSVNDPGAAKSGFLQNCPGHLTMRDINFSAIATKAAIYVTGIYQSPSLPHYPYHNLTHTERVVAHAAEIAAYYEMHFFDKFIIAVAAWFHDVGQQYGPMNGHEERGVAMMEDFLRQVPQEITAAIGRCILATKFPGDPADLPGQIICDADTYHLGTDLFRQTDVLVRKEMELRSGKASSDSEWTEKTLSLLKQHQFFTEYCQNKLNGKKLANIQLVQSQLTS